MGATVFEIGSVLMVIEALNAERESSLSISHTTFLRVCLFGPGLVGSPAFFFCLHAWRALANLEEKEKRKNVS